MARQLLFRLAIALVAFVLGVAVSSLAEAFVDSIPVDDAMCYEETPRVMVIDSNGLTHCVGGEERRLSNCP